MPKKLVIIGNGIAGITTAINVRKNSDMDILVISDETDFFFSRTALMYVYMGHMKFEHIQPYENDFWQKNNIELKKCRIQKVIPNQNEIITTDNQTINYDNLVIATGSKPNRFGWPGQDLEGVTGMYHKQELEYITAISLNVKSAVIVGGGLIGIELAEMLVSKGKKVTFLVREKSFWDNVLSVQEGKILENHILAHGVDLRLETELKNINTEDNIRLNSVFTNKNEIINCELVGLTVGVSPNIGFLVDSGIKVNKGILVNKYLQTNFENVFAVGDCAEQTEPILGRRPIEAVWYTGKLMGEALAKTLTVEKTVYNPGNWFNSAKFFDIEYQTYGLVPAILQDGQAELFWQNKEGNKSIRIVYEVGSNLFVGINALGIRLRHAFFDDMLNKKGSLANVLDNFEKANFEPEFYKNYSREIKALAL
jgi:NAD(P)H-nitrite reductase large subunit